MSDVISERVEDFRGKIGPTQKWFPQTISSSQKLVPLDHFWQSVFEWSHPAKSSPIVGPNLAAKMVLQDQIWQPKIVLGSWYLSNI